MMRDVLLATDNEIVGLLRAAADEAKDAWIGNGTSEALASRKADELHAQLVDVIEMFE